MAWRCPRKGEVVTEERLCLARLKGVNGLPSHRVLSMEKASPRGDSYTFEELFVRFVVAVFCSQGEPGDDGRLIDESWGHFPYRLPLSGTYSIRIAKIFGPERAAQLIRKVVNNISSKPVPTGAFRPATAGFGRL